MKICWDSINKLRYSKKTGKLYDEYDHYYVFKDRCVKCNEPFFSRSENGKCCSNGCSNSYRKISKETKQKMSTSGKIKIFTKEHRKNISNSHKNKVFSKEHRKNISTSKSGEKNHNWKGGYDKKGIPLYDTYASQIEWCEEVRRNEEDTNILEVKCFKCGNFFIPKLHQILNRMLCIKTNNKGDGNLYCSDECKKSCSIYGKSSKSIMKEDAIKAGRLNWLKLTREVQPELRQLVLERDNYQCVKCSNTNNLQCHHILPVAIEPLLSADVDNCMTLCYNCHKKIHQKDGCRYGQLRIEIC
jgi:5-methylcytosine-specific restriction enzyme A